MPLGNDHDRTEHRVKFHETDSELATSAASFLGRTLLDGGFAISIATPEHRRKIEEELVASGHSLSELAKPTRYLPLDAASVLESIRIGTKIDPHRFDVAVGDVMVEACATGVPVAAFGEMVDLLWEEGLPATALQLEEQWDLLATVLPFQLLCGYSSNRAYARELATARLLCLAHSRLIPPSSYRGVTEPARDSCSATEAIQLFFPVESAAMKSRRFVDGVLERWDMQFIADETLIVASELVSNAIIHARSPFEVRLTRHPDTVRIEVSDGCRVQPSFLAGNTSGRSGSGRGLAMVDTLATRWGSEPRPDGKNIWAELGCVEAC